MDKKSKFPWLYLALSYALAWLFWIPVAMTRQDYRSSPLLLIAVLVGVFGPGIAGIVLTYVEHGRRGGKEFWQRAVDVRRVRPRWWLVLIALWPVLHGLAISLTRLFGGDPPSFAFVREMAAQPFALVVVPILYLVQAGLEELGWRGYMLDRLQARFSPLGASLLLGICHAPWHLPLFWIVGTNQIKWGFGPDFWLFIAVVLAGSVYSTWCYNDNDRSTFAAIVLHFAYNISLDAFSSQGMQQRIFQVIVILGATLVAVSQLWKDRSPESIQRTHNVPAIMHIEDRPHPADAAADAAPAAGRSEMPDRRSTAAPAVTP
jgi:membrane protease YdiL (CAAX protease family)